MGAFRRVRDQGQGCAIRRRGGGRVAGAAEELGADGGDPVVAREGVVEAVEQLQARLRARCLGHGHRPGQPHDPSTGLGG